MSRQQEPDERLLGALHELTENVERILHLMIGQAEARKGFDMAKWLDERSLKCGHGFVICARCGFLPPTG